MKLPFSHGHSLLFLSSLVAMVVFVPQQENCNDLVVVDMHQGVTCQT